MSGPLTRSGDAAGASPVRINPGAGAGDVVGPASSTDNYFCLADGTTGKLIKFVQHPLDANDNELFRVASVASAVNEITLSNAASLAPPIVEATGGDTNIGIQLKPKGSGIIYLGNGDAGIDVELQWVGETNSGVMKWMEDEDYFRFDDDTFHNSAEGVFFRATTQKIHSSASSTLNINAPTLILNDANPGDIVLGDSTQRDMYPQTDLKIDLGKSSNRFNEGWIHQLHVQQSVANVANPPTDAELDSAFGTPATLGRGFIGTVDDNDSDTTLLFWLCITSDASWYYVPMTKAV